MELPGFVRHVSFNAYPYVINALIHVRFMYLG